MYALHMGSYPNTGKLLVIAGGEALSGSGNKFHRKLKGSHVREEWKREREVGSHVREERKREREVALFNSFFLVSLCLCFS